MLLITKNMCIIYETVMDLAPARPTRTKKTNKLPN